MREKNKNVCLQSNKHFKEKRYLDEHLKVHEENVFTCDQCKEEFSTARILNLHVKSTHQSVYRCNVCDIDFSSSFTLKRPNILSLEQPAPKRFACDLKAINHFNTFNI